MNEFGISKLSKAVQLAKLQSRIWVDKIIYVYQVKPDEFTVNFTNSEPGVLIGRFVRGRSI